MGRVVHFEIDAEDPARAIHFYEHIFGWKFEKWDGPMEYWLVMTGDEEVGIDGGLSPRRPEAPFHHVNTIDVKDIDSTLAMIEGHGGNVVQPKTAVPGVGWLAYCTDTEGNPFGIMQADPAAA